MYIASMDRTAAFDVARPKLVAEILGGQEAPTPLLEMDGLDGHAAFDDVDSKFNVTRWIRQGSVESSTVWRLNLARQILWNVDKEWKRRRMGIFFFDDGQGRRDQICSFL